MPSTDDARGHTLPRTHRLKCQRLIRALFDRERADIHTVRAGGLSIRYRLASEQDVGRCVPYQIGFATGRRVGTKPDRNRVKRVMREVFRVHQHGLADLFTDRPKTLTLMVLYRGSRSDADTVIRRDLPGLLQRIATALGESEGRLGSAGA